MEEKGGTLAESELPLVSVIVPVFNVLEYLDQCVESLTTQIYSNLEIILVDDGSTDGSGERCDWWAQQDRRICVLHQTNAGLARARNSGLDRMHGQYVGFLDSDDWVAEDFIESLVTNSLEYGADLSIAGSSYVYDDGTVLTHYRQGAVRVLDSAAAFCEINISGSFGVAAWDKLARVDLFNQLRFPEQIRRSEDYSVAYELLDRADVIVYDPTPRHFYRQTSESLSNNTYLVSTAPADASREMVELVRDKYPSALPYALYGHVIASVGVYNLVLRSGQRRKWSAVLNDIECLIRTERRNISSVVPLSFARRAQLWMIAYTPGLYRFALIAYKKVHPRRAE